MKKRRNFTEEFKKATVKRLLSPDGPSPSFVQNDLGIYPSTLYSWKKKYANNCNMTKSKKSSPEKWTPEQKLDAIMKTYSMSEEQRGEYLRANGLYLTDLEQFKKDSLGGFKTRGRPSLDPELVQLRKENKELERNLRRNEKALAEYSARVILLKKSHEIWGTKEDDE